ncbi:toxin glutamine deamidase domain-containing protein [Acinetobacter bereziniae]|uniref:toxin glutamine deamidase domain-containing protein n=1 Tax=Acinetobacter bereziniae TaxID=106648 RepID=UPI0035A2425A
MQNTLAAMQNVQKIISVSSTKYNEGDIITNPNDSTGLRYLVVNQNGSLKAKLLPVDYQALYSVYELNSSRALVQGGALASIVANTLKSGHDVFADRSLFTNQEMTALSRTFAGVEVVGNVLMIGGAVAPKNVKLTTNAEADAGGIKNINPTNSNQNCVNCVLAVNNELKTGAPTSALPSTSPLPFNQLEKVLGTKLSGWISKNKMEQELLKSGDGTRAVVYGMTSDGRSGHVWNAVVQNGKVNYIDRQTGSSGLNNFKQFEHIRFGKLK